MSGTINSSVRDVTEEEVATFRENGWAKLENFVAPDIIANILAAAKKRADDLESSSTSWWSEWRYAASREHNPTFMKLACSPELGRDAQILLGREKPMRLWHDIVACKRPLDAAAAASTATPWHQDGPYWSIDRPALGFWVALDHIDEKQGSLRYLSGSHREGELGMPFQSEAEGRMLDIVDQYPELTSRYAISPPMSFKPGDALVHHSNVVHSAGANETDRPRWAYIIHVIPGDALYTGQPNFDSDTLSGIAVRQPFTHPDVPQIYPPVG